MLLDMANAVLSISNENLTLEVVYLYLVGKKIHYNCLASLTLRLQILAIFKVKFVDQQH